MQEQKQKVKSTAEETSEEGGDHGKSSWPLRIGLHICYNKNSKKKQKIFE